MANEFRKDPVSGDWVLVAPDRARRPGAEENRRQWEDSHQDAAQCPFEGLSDWVTVRSNDYPALTPGVCGTPEQRGPFAIQAAHGFHELVITRDHERHFAQFTTEETADVLRVYQERYRAIAGDSCGDYISIFHNHRREAGASIWHNHSQILSTPVVPPDVRRSLEGVDRYFQQHGTTVHCALIAWEREQNKRIVFENERFIVFCPFVSKTPYELRVFPKKHAARFEQTSVDDLTPCAEALNAALRALATALDDAPYNFYIHTAPVEKDARINYDYYHWHIEIVPRTKLDAGFELGTGLAVNPVDPDAAASELRRALI
jgi:UDPglucose--hexose-1-phosphate uridylyltransferase